MDIHSNEWTAKFNFLQLVSKGFSIENRLNAVFQISHFHSNGIFWFWEWYRFSVFSFQFSIFNAIQSWWWLHSRKYVQMKLFFNKCFHHSLIILMSYFLRFVLYNTTEILHDCSNCFSVKHPLNFSKSLLQVFSFCFLERNNWWFVIIH